MAGGWTNGAPPKGIKSLSLTLNYTLKIANFSKDTLDLIWLNKKGKPENKGVVAAGKTFVLSTYDTNPIAFKNQKTGKFSGLIVGAGNEKGAVNYYVYTGAKGNPCNEESTSSAKGLKSVSSTTNYDLKVKNDYAKLVTVYWAGFKGELVKKTTLKAG